MKALYQTDATVRESRGRPFTVLLMLAALSLGSVSAIEATPILRISSGGDIFEIFDQDFFGTTPTIDSGATAAPDEHGTEGIVQYGNGVGNFLFNGTTGFTYPAIGSTELPQLHLHDFSLSSDGGGEITFEFTTTDFQNFAGLDAFRTLFGGVLGAGATITHQTYIGLTNQAFDTTTLLSDLGTLGPGGAFSGSDDATVNPAVTDTFSLTQVVTITHAGRVISSFDAHLISLPEPATIGLFGLGLLGVASRVYRGRRREEH